MAKVNMQDRMIHFVRNSIDIIIGDGEFPVLEQTLLSQGIASKKQLKALEADGYIKSIKVKVPSTLVQGQSVKYKAYYTERVVPQYVKEMEDERNKKKSFSIEGTSEE